MSSTHLRVAPVLWPNTVILGMGKDISFRLCLGCYVRARGVRWPWRSSKALLPILRPYLYTSGRYVPDLVLSGWYLWEIGV